MKLLIVQSVGLMLVASCVVQRGTPTSVPGTGATGTGPTGTGAPTTGNGSIAAIESPPPTIHGMAADWQPFPGANVRIEVPASSAESVATAAKGNFDARGSFSITLPARAQLAVHGNVESIRAPCATFAITPSDARVIPAVVAVYNAAGNRTGLLLNGDAPVSLGEAPRGTRHSLVFADVATKLSGGCSTPTELRYDVTLVAGWNVLAYATA